MPEDTPAGDGDHAAHQGGEPRSGARMWRRARALGTKATPSCDDSHMATNLAIDPDLLERAVAVSGERTKTAAVKRALEEFIARRQQGKIVEIFGTLEWDPQYDYKAARSRN